MPGTSGAEHHAAFVYLMDTMLDGKSNWIVAAHPDSSAFKRKARRTSTNLIGGGSYIEYWWFSWGSTTTPTALSVYEDATYTSTPGDLCTDTTNNINGTIPAGTANWKFWSSDQASNAVMMTKGKHLFFYDPGWTSAVFYNDTSWTGATDSLRTQMMPYVNGTLYLGACGYPNTNTASTASEFYGTFYAAGWIAAGYKPSGDFIYKNISLSNGNSTNSGGGTGSEFFCALPNDVVAHYPSGATVANREIGNASTTDGLLIFDGTNYYFRPSSNMTCPALMLDMGTSEPNFT